MRISIVGMGRVGLVTGVSLASMGHDVIGTDTNVGTIEMLRQGRCSFFEPGLEELLAEQLAAGRIRFTSSVGEALGGAKIVFICVGRPEGADGDMCMTSVETVASEVGRHASHGVVVVVRSTVPPGTCERIERTIELEHPQLRFHVVSNPEFLRGGFALEDALQPTRIVVGASDDDAFRLVRRVYRDVLQAGCVLIETDRRTAELAKLASNSFLATKVSFANALAAICELADADVEGVAEIMGSDPRIGPAFLRAGIGYGGHNLPRDVASLQRLALRYGYHLDLLAEVARVNDDAVTRVARKVEDALWNLEGKRVALFGLAFKARTDDIGSAPALVLARMLIERGAEVVGYDPIAADVAKEEIAEMRTVTDPYQAAEGTHCVVICTEWREFRELDLGHLGSVMRYPVVVDARNLLDPEAMREAGFLYIGVGRGGRSSDPATLSPAPLVRTAARG
jgi:UDPglucose 6-dehydrogenase